MSPNLYDAVMPTDVTAPGYSTEPDKISKNTITYAYPPNETTAFTTSKKMIDITKVIFNDPATIVFWSNGDKTVVKCCENDVFDPEKGLAMAICKYVFGNGNDFHRVFKDWLPEETEAEASTSFFGVSATTKPVMDPFSKALKSLSDTTELMGKIWGISKKEGDHVE